MVQYFFLLYTFLIKMYLDKYSIHAEFHKLIAAGMKKIFTRLFFMKYYVHID